MRSEWCPCGCQDLVSPTSRWYPYSTPECRSAYHAVLEHRGWPARKRAAQPATLSIDGAYQELAGEAGLTDFYNNTIRS